jgi:predicted RNase H-like HicB family nuclease
MLSVYPACFFKDENGYSVIFPDLDWLGTCGDTLEEAMQMAVDCLAGYLHTLHMDGEEIPAASNMDDIHIKVAEELDVVPAADSAFINLVAVDVEEYAKAHFEKSVKKTLTIPVWLNNAALEQNINFSHVLKEALIHKLKEH